MKQHGWASYRDTRNMSSISIYPLNRFTSSIFLSILLACVNTCQLRAAEPKPLRALLITGGCCHEYAKQKDVLKNGLEARLNIVLDQIHTDDSSTHPPLPFL